MRKIKTEAHPDAARLSKLKVNAWPEGEKESSIMPWTYIESAKHHV